MIKVGVTIPVLLIAYIFCIWGVFKLVGAGLATQGHDASHLERLLDHGVGREVEGVVG